jgi:hypothetical protein
MPERETAYSSDTTLGDLNRRDRDNFDHVLKHDAKTYRFASVNDARKFMGHCFDLIMRKCGAKVRPGMDSNRIDRLMRKHNVKVEHREYPPDEPLYQTGMYIYKNGEIAGFVSSPFRYHGALVELLPQYFIRTTARIHEH